MTINLDQYTNTLNVTDTATNADINLTTKGTGAVSLNTGNGISFKVSDAGSTSTGHWNTFGGGTASQPRLTATSSSNAWVQNGTGSAIIFATNAGSGYGTIQALVSHTASAVNYVQATGAATGSGPTISAQGSDTNIDLNLTTKGTGVVVATGGTLQAATTGSNGNLYLGGPNVSLRSAYSANVFGMYTNNAEQVRIGNVASAVNYIQLVGAATGSGVILSSQGSDTNIDLTLTPKGTGNVRFGTYTANMALTIQGYVEIKDSGGTVRRLAVIA